MRMAFMRSSSNKSLIGCLALTLCFLAAAPFATAQGAGSASDTKGGASTGSSASDAIDKGKRRVRALLNEVDSQSGTGDVSDELARRARMRKAIMRARQMQGQAGGQASSQSPGQLSGQALGQEGMDAAQEPIARGPNVQAEGFGGGFRKGRRGFMQDGQFGGRRGFAGRGGGFGGRKALDLTALNLTDEQKAKIQQLRKGTATRVREVRRKLFSGGQELRDMMFDPSASDDQIRAKGKELRKLHEQAEDMKLDDFLAIRGVLTPEQRKRLPDVKPGGPRAAMVSPGAPRRADGMPPDGGESGGPNQ